MKVSIISTRIYITPTTKVERFRISLGAVNPDKAIKEVTVKTEPEWWRIFETAESVDNYIAALNG